MADMCMYNVGLGAVSHADYNVVVMPCNVVFRCWLNSTYFHCAVSAFVSSKGCGNACMISASVLFCYKTSTHLEGRTVMYMKLSKHDPAGWNENIHQLGANAMEHIAALKHRGGGIHASRTGLTGVKR